MYLKNTTQPHRSADYATFYIQKALCGIDLLKVQEINKPTGLTQVPQAPDFVMGVMNLRGRIVSIIDVCRKLGLPQVQVDDANRNIIVRSREEHIGLRVYRISDVVAVKSDCVEAPPANLNGIQGKFFHGVFKSDDHLVGLLDIDALLD
jgi:purine-binding chemotaxis protein CheW